MPSIRLIVMAAEGMAAPALWALLSTDLAVSAGAGVMAWQGLGRARHTPSISRSLVGTEGVSLSDLDPEGIARVGGEQWSVVSLNGRVRAGTRVQVLRAEGVRLEVWGEDPDVLPVDWPSLPSDEAVPSEEAVPSDGAVPPEQAVHSDQALPSEATELYPSTGEPPSRQEHQEQES